MTDTSFEAKNRSVYDQHNSDQLSTSQEAKNCVKHRHKLGTKTLIDIPRFNKWIKIICTTVSGTEKSLLPKIDRHSPISHSPKIHLLTIFIIRNKLIKFILFIYLFYTTIPVTLMATLLTRWLNSSFLDS